MSENKKHTIDLNRETAELLSNLLERQTYTEKILKSLSQVVLDLHMQVKQTRASVQALSASHLKPNGRKVRAVFLVNSIELWDSLFDVYQAMLESDIFEPFVATINRRFGGDTHFSGEKRASDGLDKLNIPHLRLDMEDSFTGLNILRGLAPDVIFRQSQWDDLYPPAFSSDYLSFAKLCVVPYGIIVLEKYMSMQAEQEGVNKISCDTPYHRAAWRIFCENRYALQYFESFSHAPSEKLVLSGYPKLQRLLNEAPSWPTFDAQPKDKKAFRVIWAPHHSSDNPWLNFGVFHRIYQDFVAWARETPDIEFVLKPHPELFKSVVNRKVMQQEDVDGFLKEWLSLPNCAYENERYGGLFAASDLMITDGISFFIEYPIFDKPLIFFNSGVHAELNSVGKLAIACADTVYTFEDMKQTALGYKNKTIKDTHNPDREHLKSILFPDTKPSCEIILENIADGLGIKVEGSVS
ncbi:CDP-glycerol glycerophosphotransferase family protein [Komagataeibacter sp. FNDCR2]|uniref:CDP-glycerol glycerophosphotransferase family protein n=1 Tax=Komagataeibacter sp. FNDCR2 TaxID=2878682 RepID=UPI001E3FE8F5|nr:CDP-glycerol glycerophosphotransferase family protein [Komagataeibacter sp. FNDCR2]MCE2576782.1 CDP-glycerol glycerophosphotransferase family protein [Komagataeibacter sp. FNDCR2]